MLSSNIWYSLPNHSQRRPAGRSANWSSIILNVNLLSEKCFVYFHCCSCFEYKQSIPIPFVMVAHIYAYDACVYTVHWIWIVFVNNVYDYSCGLIVHQIFESFGCYCFYFWYILTFQTCFVASSAFITGIFSHIFSG